MYVCKYSINVNSSMTVFQCSRMTAQFTTMGHVDYSRCHSNYLSEHSQTNDDTKASYCRIDLHGVNTRKGRQPVVFRPFRQLKKLKTT